jgi:hypothetical protein
MTANDYFDFHLPHRVNLLTTFRERYAQTAVPNPSRPKQNFGEPRDFFRCSKDISIMMVRFFCDEMGLYLPKGSTLFEERKAGHCRFNIQPFTLSEAQADPSKNVSLLVIMKAANRAVAHINDLDVDHPIKVQHDHQVLFDTINWVEELIETHIYAPNRRSLSDALKLADNVM